MVAPGFTPEHIADTEFQGEVKLGVFEKEFHLVGGAVKHSGIRRALLCNVEVGDNTLIENVSNYIANYTIGHDTFVCNVHTVLTDTDSTFGNGVEVSVLNETGGREVVIYDRLTAQIAYVMALYRHRPAMIDSLRRIISAYTESVRSSVGRIGNNVMMVDANYVRNVRIDDYCRVEGASRLRNGSVHGSQASPSVVGNGVIADNFGWSAVFTTFIIVGVIGILVFVSMWGAPRDGYQRSQDFTAEFNREHPDGSEA